MTESVLRYFATPSPATDLSGYADLVDELPSDANDLAAIVRGLLIHEGVVALRKLKFPSERFVDRKRQGAASIVSRVLELDPSRLSVEHPEQGRMIGYCYHFAVLHCAFLRAKGVPARARCGFAAYFRADTWIDHWVVEYWDGTGWILIDPDAGRNVLSRDDFHHAGSAWELCRTGAEDASRHGNYTLWGWDELRGSLINDIGALNKVEVSGWDWCDRIAVEHIERPNEALDDELDPLARMVSSDSDFEQLRDAFLRDPGLPPPDFKAE